MIPSFVYVTEIPGKGQFTENSRKEATSHRSQRGRTHQVTYTPSCMVGGFSSRLKEPTCNQVGSPRRVQPRVIWKNQMPRKLFAAAIRHAPRRRGGTFLALGVAHISSHFLGRGWLWSSLAWWPAGGGGGGICRSGGKKPKVLSLVKHRLLQHEKGSENCEHFSLIYHCAVKFISFWV